MTNKIVYAGLVLDDPVFSHKDLNKKYYRVRISCKRMNSRNDRTDIVPVVIEESLIREADVRSMAFVKVTGRFCSRLIQNEDRSYRRHNYILAHDVVPWKIDVNELEVVGIVEKEPVVRKNANGDLLCEVLIKNKTQNTEYYLPIVFWGKKVKKATKLMPGDVIEVTGMLQSRRGTRMYKNNPVGCTLTECSVFEFRKLEGDVDAESTSF